MTSAQQQSRLFQIPAANFLFSFAAFIFAVDGGKNDFVDLIFERFKIFCFANRSTRLDKFL